MGLLEYVSSLTLTEWTVGVLAFFLFLYIVGTWNYGHFSSRGAKYFTPVPFLGSMSPIVFKTESFPSWLESLYNQNKDLNFIGIYQFFTPIVMLQDPELIKKVTVKDFDAFVDHQDTIGGDPVFNKTLFALKGNDWRDMRSTVSPAFTSSKMKNMFNFMNQCGEQLADYLHNEILQQEKGKIYSVEMKELFSRFTNDVIATSAFGIHTNSLKDKNNEFFTMGKSITSFVGLKSIKFLGFMLCSKLMRFFNVSFFSKNEREFFVSLIHDAITTREREGIVRPDMLHLLMQARGGEIKTEAGEEDMSSGVINGRKTKLDEGDITSQAIAFFFSGFDTASTLLSFLSHQIGVHEEVQQRLLDEIDEVLGDGKVTYEKIQKMKYMDMVISETLRLNAPAVFMDRKAVRDYTIPASDKQPEYTIKKGEGVWIPVCALHRDPQYFPDPEKFDPERFSDENKHNINPFVYMPFGSGPRFCVGQRFALLETKVALVHILSRFNFRVVEKTPIPLVITKKSFNLTADGGFWLGITHRQKLI